MSSKKMVETQLKPRGVKDPKVLAAVAAVDRAHFVPESYRSFAYSDCPLPLALGQTISQPYMVAAMTELLQPQPQGRILEIGTGSGYQTAILAELVAQVFTIEIHDSLSENALALLKKLGYQNVTGKTGDGWFGWPEEGPFDGIILTAAPEHAPLHLLDQLKHGGRMVAPCGPTHQNQSLLLFEKDQEGKILESWVMGVRFVPLTGNH